MAVKVTTKDRVRERRHTEDVVTVQEMMDILAIGKNTAYKLLKDGVIKSFRIGKTYKVLTCSLKEYIYDRQ